MSIKQYIAAILGVVACIFSLQFAVPHIKFAREILLSKYETVIEWSNFNASYGRNTSVTSQNESFECPMVYVYDRNNSLNFIDVNIAHLYNHENDVFGRMHNSKNVVTYATNQWSLAEIFLWRLRPGSKCRTDNPTHADLFFVPFFPKPKSHKQWENACSQINQESYTNYEKQLTFLNEKTATKHFMVVGKGYYNAKYCYGIWAKPKAHFINVQRLSVHPLCQQFGIVDYPNHFATFYPSSIHWRNGKNPLQLSQIRRDILMSFVGKTNHGKNITIRQRIRKECEFFFNCTIKRFSETNVQIKSKSVFCLEPTGDSFVRKSIADSLAMGCIPVFFNNMLDHAFEWLNEDWNKLTVVINGTFMLQSEIGYLAKILTQMNQTMIAMKQKLIWKNLQYFQYSFDDEIEDLFSKDLQFLLKNSH